MSQLSPAKRPTEGGGSVHLGAWHSECQLAWGIVCALAFVATDTCGATSTSAACQTMPKKQENGYTTWTELRFFPFPENPP